MTPGPRELKRKAIDKKSISVINVLHRQLSCPFREFKDTELTPDSWGTSSIPEHFTMSRQSVRISLKPTDSLVKSGKGDKGILAHALAALPEVWDDPQIQPLPRSARSLLNRWVKAEELATTRWNVDIVIAEENCVKITPMEIQMAHAQVLHRSSFCREVFSACYILENLETFEVEHQWENFTCSVGDGWFAKYHIYSPGMKPGGGPQHKPMISRNGCYLVRLFYLGAWRCVWVNDNVPVDSTDAPLLPFCPLFPVAPPKPVSGKASAAPQVKNVQLWPLLLCKALLKLAAPKLDDTEDNNIVDEEMTDFNILHALTGSLEITYQKQDIDKTWRFLQERVHNFSWDDEEPNLRAISQMKNAKATKKSMSSKTVASGTSKSTSSQNSVTMLVIQDSKSFPPYYLPGVTPSHEMRVFLNMVRDVPIKKPLPEPEVSLWKTYRWVDWAKAHGLYKEYECPRTKFIRIMGLLKLSYAPHLLDVMSSESITSKLRVRIPGKDEKIPPPHSKQTPQERDKDSNGEILKLMREELRDWAVYDLAYTVINTINVLYYPHLHKMASAGSEHPVRLTKIPWDSNIDMIAPPHAPLYLQADASEPFSIKIGLSTINPRVLFNCRVPVAEYFEPAYLYLEEFHWFEDDFLSDPTAFIKTRGHNTVQADFPPGRHICRVWVHSRIQWHVMILSEEHIVLGSKDVLMETAVTECAWARKFLAPISAAFQTWIKIHRPHPNIVSADREFFKSYQPTLEWDPNVISTPKSFLHWMFRKAIQSILFKKLPEIEYFLACKLLRYVFMDPEFGLVKKAPVQRLEIIPDYCDCVDEGMQEESSLIEEVNEKNSKEINLKEKESKEEIEEKLQEENLKEEMLREEKLKDSTITSRIDISDNIKPKMPVTSVISPTTLVKTPVCDLADEQMSCVVLKEIKNDIIDRYRAVIVLQSHFRGYLTRKCLKSPVQATADVLKIINESVFGSDETVSDLMNEFFLLFPEVKPAYKLSSALVGTTSFQKYAGISEAHSKSQWVPFFQNTFYCHNAVRVQFDLKSFFEFCLLDVYNNDTEQIVPKIYNVPKCYDFVPNEKGYTLIGYASLKTPCEIGCQGQWWLTILCSLQNSFHLCDNDPFCNELILVPARDLFYQETFMPNRQNILGGIRIGLYTDEVVSFRARTSNPDLEIEAIVKTVPNNGDVREFGRIKGKGEINWSFIKLAGCKGNIIQVRQGYLSMNNLKANSGDVSSTRSTRTPKTRFSASKSRLAEPELKNYLIELIAPKGWPLSLKQWENVEDERQHFENKIAQAVSQQTPVRSAKDKKGGKEHDKREKLDHPEIEMDFCHSPVPGAAYTEFQCSYNPTFGALANRDDSREKAFVQAFRSWSEEPGRNERGILLREAFLEAFKASGAIKSSVSDFGEEFHSEEKKKDKEITKMQQKKDSAVKNSLASIEEQEEILYLSRPVQLKDKFRSFDFLDECTRVIVPKEKTILTDEMLDEWKISRHENIKKSIERMEELQKYNTDFMLKRQKRRCQLTDKLLVDATWKGQILGGYETRDEAIAEETLRRTQSLIKKKEAVAHVAAATKTTTGRKKNKADIKHT